MRGFTKTDKPALLISECQKGVLDRQLSLFHGLIDHAEGRNMAANIAQLAAEFRRQGLPVIHIHVAHKPDYAGVPVTNVIVARTIKTGGMREGTPDVEAIPGLEPQPGDIVHSRSVSLVAFNKTDLDAVLKSLGVTTLVLCGVSANIALPGMAVCGSDLGYQVVVAEDCIAGASAESYDFAIRQVLPLYSTLLSSGEIVSKFADLS